MPSSFDLDVVRTISPKRRGAEARNDIYPYYMGFSHAFAQAVVREFLRAGLDKILDPWNGSGTTTTAAALLGATSTGVDLNPAMRVAAIGRLGATGLPHRIDVPRRPVERDPLLAWFSVNCAARIRAWVTAGAPELRLGDVVSVGSQNADVCRFLTVSFRVVRDLLQAARGSNPTWIAETFDAKVDVASGEVDAAFQTSLEQWGKNELSFLATSHVLVGDSRNVNLPDAAVNAIVTSPPYCTRIDYAVATTPELAVLGFGRGEWFDRLRDDLLGTTTITADATELKPDPDWGPTCGNLLDSIRTHGSHASATYYYRNHVQYFSGLFQSLAECARVLAPGGIICLAVQDSYYKEVLNDLPRIVSEMMGALGLSVTGEVKYISNATMANVHKAREQYSRRQGRTESLVVARRSFST